MQTSKPLHSALESAFAAAPVDCIYFSPRSCRVKKLTTMQLSWVHLSESGQVSLMRRHEYWKLLAVNVIKPSMTALPWGPAKGGSLSCLHCWEVQLLTVGWVPLKFLVKGCAGEPTQRSLQTPLHSCSQDRIQTKLTEMKTSLFLKNGVCFTELLIATLF